MIRLGGNDGPSPADAEEEKRMANMAVAGTTLSFFAVCFAIHVSPFFLEQLGFTVTK